MFLKQGNYHKLMSVKKPYILEYVKRKTKDNLQIFLSYTWSLNSM